MLALNNSGVFRSGKSCVVLFSASAMALSCQSRSANDGRTRSFDPGSVNPQESGEIAAKLELKNGSGIPKAVVIDAADIAGLELDSNGSFMASLLMKFVGNDDSAYQSLLSAWLDDWQNGGNVDVLADDQVVKVDRVNDAIKISGTNVAVPDRPGIKLVRDAWPKGANNQFSTSQSPFKLVAIMNRVDLWNPTKPDTPMSQINDARDVDAGETRFVFGFRNANGAQGPGSQMTIIFEYRNPTTVGGSSRGVTEWAKIWADVVDGNGEYSRANLDKLIEDVTSTENAFRGDGQGSMERGQIRTNEFINGFNGNTPQQAWNLREFKLRRVGRNMRLVHTDVKQSFHADPRAQEQFSKDSALGEFLMKTGETGEHNFEYAADGQFADGFKAFGKGRLYSGTLKNGAGSPRVLKGTELGNDILEEVGKKPNFDFDCFTAEDRGGLPGPIKQQIRSSEQAAPDRFLAAVSRGVEFANCSGCHVTTVPTVERFLHITADGAFSDFVKGPLTEERVEFMKAALNPGADGLKYLPTQSVCTTRGLKAN